MGGFKFWKRSRVYRPELLLQQLEERIVLDAAVNPAQQDHPSDHQGHAHHHHLNPDGTAAKMLGLDTGSGAGGGDAGLAAKVPDSYDHVFNQDLNVVLISNALTDVKTISDAAAKDAKVIVYDAQHDNLATVVGKLDDLVKSTGHKLGTVALFDHGGDGFLDVGTDQINLHNLWAYEAKFESLRQDLASGAQIQFYACDTAGNVLGTDLVNSIALFAGANVFASVDDTGGPHGNWTLEYSSSTGASFHPIIDSVSLVSMQADLGGNPGEPMNTWFHGTGTFAGWDIFNYSSGVYYTKDYATFWDHKDAGGWNYYNTSAWVTTDTLGDAPYGDGSHYHSVNNWFTVASGVGQYSGHNAYIGSGVEYYQDNLNISPPLYWAHYDSNNSWSFWDSSVWRSAPGFNAFPQNTWFHVGKSYDAYGYSGGWYYTQDYKVFWDGQNSGTWKYYNGTTWVTTDTLWDVPYRDGYGPLNTWFRDSVPGGIYNGYDVYIGTGVMFFSTNHSDTGATFWQQTAAGAWSYYDGSAWNPSTGFNVEPVNVWFNGYGADAGYHVYNYSGGALFTKDYVTAWNQQSSGAWQYYNGSALVDTDALGWAPYGDGSQCHAVGQWFTVSGMGALSGHQCFIADSSPIATTAIGTYLQTSYPTGAEWYKINSNLSPSQYYVHLDVPDPIYGTQWFFQVAGSHTITPVAGFGKAPANTWVHDEANQGYDFYIHPSQDNPGIYYTSDGHLWNYNTSIGYPYWEYDQGVYGFQWVPSLGQGIYGHDLTSGVAWYHKVGESFTAPGGEAGFSGLQVQIGTGTNADWQFYWNQSHLYPTTWSKNALPVYEWAWNNTNSQWWYTGDGSQWYYYTTSGVIPWQS